MKKYFLFAALFSFWVNVAFAQTPIAIDGPSKSDAGQLCVFTLTDEKATADWTIVPLTEFYVDKGGQSLIFASPSAAKYTIVAATILEDKPLVLTFSCDYGTDTSPNPDPKPDPKPEPKTIREWVALNIPADGQKDVTAIAKCYDDAASSMERGTIRTVDAGYAGVRMCSQSKADTKIWGGFFDTLGQKVADELGKSTNTRDLAKIFREIAAGLRGDSDKNEEKNAEPAAMPASRSTGNCPTGRCPVR